VPGACARVHACVRACVWAEGGETRDARARELRKALSLARAGAGAPAPVKLSVPVCVSLRVRARA